MFRSLSSIGQIIWVDELLNRLYKEPQSFGNTFSMLFYQDLGREKNAIAIHNVVVSLSPGENGREHISVP